jgi:Recombinase zinc beta ribbon domain
VQRWNLPDGWVISARPAHPALVSEADFIAAQNISAARGPAPVIAPAAPGRRRYLLAGLLACGTCGRRMESAWSNGKAAYRCRHGHTSAAPPDPARPKNAYVREDRILAHLPALHLLLTGTEPARRRRRTRRGADTRPQAGADDVIGYMRDRGITLTYDPAAEPCRQAPAKPSRPLSGKQANPRLTEPPRRKGEEENRRSPGTGASLRPGGIPACHKIAGYGVLLCPRGIDPIPPQGSICYGAEIDLWWRSALW